MRPPHHAGEMDRAGVDDHRIRRTFNEAPASRGGNVDGVGDQHHVEAPSMRPPHHAGEMAATALPALSAIGLQ